MNCPKCNTKMIAVYHDLTTKGWDLVRDIRTTWLCPDASNHDKDLSKERNEQEEV